jgi:competence protein ComEA
MPRLALLLLLALLLVPALLRSTHATPPRDCSEEGRGAAPRHWLGCATDDGPPRGLSGDELLLLGRPLDPNRARARELAFLPGLSVALAQELVLERQEGGPFCSIDDLLRVRGIGPKRLARARPFLELGADSAGVAERGE